MKKRHTCQRRLNFFYKQPNPLVSLEQFLQYAHEDLQEMTPALLKKERARIRLRLLYDECPSRWFLERLRKIEGALQ